MLSANQNRVILSCIILEKKNLQVLDLERLALLKEKIIRYFEKLGCVHGLNSTAFTLYPRNPSYTQSFCFLIFSASFNFMQKIRLEAEYHN